jgi:hypothetical protein
VRKIVADAEREALQLRQIGQSRVLLDLLLSVAGMRVDGARFERVPEVDERVLAAEVVVPSNALERGQASDALQSVGRGRRNSGELRRGIAD